MNPKCKCGCGHEVGLPRNIWIKGHWNTVAFTPEGRKDAERLLASEMSSADIGKIFERSAATILNWRYFGIPPNRGPAERVWRQEDIDREANEREEYWSWKKAKRMLRDIRMRLRDQEMSPKAE